MTWFCVSKIFGPVGPEKMVICDRSAFAERSSRGGHWPSEKLRFAEITGYVHAGRFRMTNGHPYGEDMALHRRGDSRLARPQAACGMGNDIGTNPSSPLRA